LETYKGKWFWTGRVVKGIEKLLDKWKTNN
jgi:hypothetical protein